MKKDIKDTIKSKYPLIFPRLTSERSQKFFGLTLTLCAISFFGFFAIKPTISTILELQKEVSDSKLVFNQLETKIKNLSELRKQYSALQTDLPILMNAITAQPDVQILFAQIQSVAKTSDINIKKLQNFEVDILRSNRKVDKNYSSYSFTISGSGTLKNVFKFLQALTNMERIVSIDTFSTNNITDKDNESLDFDIQGTAFFKDNP